MDAPPPTIDDLLAHEPFLRQLALGLIGNRDLAEEAVQDTWLVALRRPPAHAVNLRGWLGMVLRNVARDRFRRSERARRAHERLGIERADVYGTGSGGGASAGSPRLQSIGAGVSALPEPYRTVLLLRFYYDRSRSEIAALLDRPLNTVNSQILRGLEHLQAHLERCREHGHARGGTVLPSGGRWPATLVSMDLAGR